MGQNLRRGELCGIKGKFVDSPRPWVGKSVRLVRIRVVVPAQRQHGLSMWRDSWSVIASVRGIARGHPARSAVPGFLVRLHAVNENGQSGIADQHRIINDHYVLPLAKGDRIRTLDL